jgi:signal transduction histidine kinase/ligand-binding sensor domain-containing protein
MERRAGIAFGILLACCPCASALNPSLDINQYAHTAWPIREGLFKSIINSIAQTPDGFLWLGTEFGLLRFDGVKAAAWTPPGPERLPSGSIYTLMTARDGTVWIGTDTGLASWNGTKLNLYPQLDGYRVQAIFQDHEGTIWIGGLGSPSGRLCAIRGGTVRCYGEDGGFGRAVLSIYELHGDLWVSAEPGIWRWKPGDSKLYPMPALGRDFSEGLNDINGHLLISTASGLQEFVDGDIKRYPIPDPGQQLRFKQLLRDRDGALWIGTTDEGLIHVHDGRTDRFSLSGGLSGDYINTLFEDREGNIWVATSGGLDRFREFAVSTIAANQGLSTGSAWAVLAARDGAVWMGNRSGLSRWYDGRITMVNKVQGLPHDPPQSFFYDDAGRIWLFTNHELGYLQDGVFLPVTGIAGEQVHAIAGDNAGNLWLSEDRDLLRVTAGSVVERIPWSRLGADEHAIALLPGRQPGELWLGFRLGRGVIHFKDGQIRQSYQAAGGLGEGAVEGLKLDQDDALWAATAGGLSLIKNGRAATLTSKNGLPCDTVHWVMDDDDRSTWLYMACGLVRLDRTELDAWKADSRRAVHPTVFDSSDGITGHSSLISGYSPRVAKSVNGKLWFVTGDGVSVIDPRHLPFNKLPPPVHIEQITADRKTYEASSKVRLPPLVRDLEIDYTALSLVAPEKIRFRVKLEGRDPDWKDVGNERKAFYNDLPPRNYRFRVAASNNSGVWNEAGTFFDFSIAPAYYQTAWFQASCAAAFFLMLWGLYRYRLHQIAREFNARLDERVNERTRIARDLHDTLLQSFQGLMLRFQVAHDELPGRPAEARKTLENALDQAAQAVTEGRDAVQGLRSSGVETNDLARAIGALGAELAGGEELAGEETDSNRVESFVDVEGTPRDIHPILRDEIYRIAGEALRNAFRHAQAKRIEVTIWYGVRQFRLRVRDDGKGIDPEVVDKQGRAGHWGLAGMRERAELIGGQLEMWSQRESGTQIELSIPASLAYGTSPARRFRWFAKKTGTNS